MRFLISFALFLCLSPSLAHAWPATILEVVDGDTITVAPVGQRDAPIRVRLYGIDAPEHDQPGGAASTAALREMLPNESTAEIVPMNTDRYGRTVGLVIRDGKTVNLDMVKHGQAWVYQRYCRAYFCRQWARDAKEARQQKAGLWGGNKGEIMPPWEWRRKR